MPKRHILPFLLAILAFAASPLPAQTTRPVPEIQRAVIISVDGLRPDLLIRAQTPAIRDLIARGTYSFWARTTPQSITLPSHTSMLTGATVRHHGIEWNRDLPFSQPVWPKVPSLFELARKAGYTTAIAAGKSKFVVFNKPGALDWQFITPKEETDDAEVATEAVKLIQSHQPQVLFVHLPSVDVVGHDKGWGSGEQVKTVESADRAIALVLGALKEKGLDKSTFVLVTADHGGAGRDHGPDDARSRHIPWIAVGPGIGTNVDLTTDAKLEINTEDTFATVCWLLAIDVPHAIDGKPIRSIVQPAAK